MFIVGLTGGIATGKSTVAEVFREHGIPVIDADVIARKAFELMIEDNYFMQIHRIVSASKENGVILPLSRDRPSSSSCDWCGLDGADNHTILLLKQQQSPPPGLEQVVEPGRKAWHKIKKEFGEGVFDKNGNLNREALGEIIFENIEMRKKLNEITHPEITREMFWSAVRCFFKGHPFIVMDLPLLFESGSMIEYIYKIIVVTCEEDLQLQRLMDRNSMSESRAKKRISAQMPLESKCEKAHFVVENSGTVEDTRQQVLRILSILRTYRVHWKIRAIAGICCTGILSLLIWLGAKFWFSSQPAITRR